MGRRGRDLAQRFKRAVHAQALEAAELQAAEARERERKQALRTDLLNELEAFAHEIGVLEVRWDSESLVLGYGERTLSLVPVGDADVLEVTSQEVPEDHRHRLYLELRIGELWVWEWMRGHRVDREPLWDVGLEHLLVEHLGLPAPG